MPKYLTKHVNATYGAGVESDGDMLTSVGWSVPLVGDTLTDVGIAVSAVGGSDPSVGESVAILTLLSGLGVFPVGKLVL